MQCSQVGSGHVILGAEKIDARHKKSHETECWTPTRNVSLLSPYILDLPENSQKTVLDFVCSSTEKM